MARPPVSEQVQVNFRMPVDLRDRIREAAEANSRSLNAEIVARLEDSFREGGPEPNEENTIFMVLDAKGHPMSWPEIYAHLYRIGKAVGWLPYSLKAAIFNADMSSSLDRDREYASLIRWYQRASRELRKTPPEDMEPRPPERPLRPKE